MGLSAVVFDIEIEFLRRPVSDALIMKNTGICQWQVGIIDHSAGDESRGAEVR